MTLLRRKLRGGSGSLRNPITDVRDDALTAYAGVQGMEVLKIDIGRSERDERWLPGVRSLVIELHCTRAFFPAMEHYEYRLSHRGDLTYCLDLKERSSGLYPRTLRTG
jgi:hypothetical protein